MQKITEIREYHTVKRRETVNGVTTFVEKQVARVREVPVVDGLARFGHFLLDRVFMWVIGIAIGILLGVILALTGNTDIMDAPMFDIFDRLFSWLILQPAYYFIFEASMGSSPAKAILGRVVVDEYGNKPSTRQVLIRSFSRCVPFEVFSCLGTRGWHDTWSNTFVIRKKDLEELRLLQKINNLNENPQGGKIDKNDSDQQYFGQ